MHVCSLQFLNLKLKQESSKIFCFSNQYAEKNETTNKEEIHLSMQKSNEQFEVNLVENESKENRTLSKTSSGISFVVIIFRKIS